MSPDPRNIGCPPARSKRVNLLAQYGKKGKIRRTKKLNGRLTGHTSPRTPLGEHQRDRLIGECLLPNILRSLSISLLELGSLKPPRFRDRTALVVLLERNCGGDEGLYLRNGQVGESEEMGRGEVRFRGMESGRRSGGEGAEGEGTGALASYGSETEREHRCWEERGER
jgi:hypothetical protein